VKKICFIASTGGHFEQLMMLKPLMIKYNSFIVTEKTKYDTKSVDINQYYLIQVNRRELTFILKMFINIIKSLIIFFKEKPDIVISTGVLATIPMCIITKVFKKKLIYIESFAKINSPTLTGKLLYKYADAFYIQWEELIKFYPSAIYKGGIY
jgi:UDP-N-acetylglucosamine:LPS N-acetylglucosamine transferase